MTLEVKDQVAMSGLTQVWVLQGGRVAASASCLHGGWDFRTGDSWQMQSWSSAGSIPAAWLKQTWAYKRRDLSHVPSAVRAGCPLRLFALTLWSQFSSGFCFGILTLGKKTGLFSDHFYQIQDERGLWWLLGTV